MQTGTYKWSKIPPAERIIWFILPTPQLRTVECNQKERGCVCVRAYVCVCVCVREREREKELGCMLKRFSPTSNTVFCGPLCENLHSFEIGWLHVFETGSSRLIEAGWSHMMLGIVTQSFTFSCTLVSSESVLTQVKTVQLELSNVLFPFKSV